MALKGAERSQASVQLVSYRALCCALNGFDQLSWQSISNIELKIRYQSLVGALDQIGPFTLYLRFKANSQIDFLQATDSA
tara:strand:+ start:5630 stop:5869 length:240 start_codon:yes stop_codon:yes gene_type:complete